MNEAPYLTIVATTRNDNHGGDLLARTACFVQGIYHQSRKFQLAIELILVEWNPPLDKPLLEDVLPKPPKDSLVSLRYIIVPQEVHQRINHSDILPLHQMIAKNVGIRRARGKFILSTNIDLLFSDDCFRIIAAKNLDVNVFYRAVRCDVPQEVLELASVEEQLEFSKRNVLKTLGYTHNYKHVLGFPDFFWWYPNLLAGIDKGLGHLKKYLPRKASKMKNIYALNTFASGDFVIMSKSVWKRIKGYYELEMFPLHIDSMALISAYAMGVEQFTFPASACAYHIYHGDGWESRYKDMEEILGLIERRYALGWHGIVESGKRLLSLNRPYELNDENWGFADVDFEELVL